MTGEWCGGESLKACKLFCNHSVKNNNFKNVWQFVKNI